MIIADLWEKIAGRKRPALVDPSHKVRQGGKGSVWDGQTDRWTLPVHFRSTSSHFQSTSGPFGHHRWSYEASQDTGRTPDGHNKFCVTHRHTDTPDGHRTDTINFVWHTDTQTDTQTDRHTRNKKSDCIRSLACRSGSKNTHWTLWTPAHLTWKMA